MTSRGAPARACDRPASPAQSSVRSPRWSHPETPPPLTLSPLSLASLARTPIPTNNERTNAGKGGDNGGDRGGDRGGAVSGGEKQYTPFPRNENGSIKSFPVGGKPCHCGLSHPSTPPLHLQGGHVVQGRERQVGLDRTRHMLHPAHAAQPRARRASARPGATAH